MNTKKKLRILGAGAGLFLVCVILICLHGFFSDHVLLRGRFYPRELRELTVTEELPEELDVFGRFHGLEQLDLRPAGATPEQYEALRALLPECEIFWDLPFQGQLYPLDTDTMTLTSLTEEEVPLLDYLPGLSSVYAWECRDYEALMVLQTRRPECKVFYNVEIQGTLYDCDTAALELSDCAGLDLESVLAGLPRLRAVRFTGDIPTARQLKQLQERFPQIAFSWEFPLNGERLDSDTATLSLPGGSGFTLYQLDQLLNYLPALEILDLGDTDHPEEALLALERGHPGLTIFWDMDVLGVTANRGAKELDLSGIPVKDLSALETRLALMPNLQKVIMSGCGLGSPEMDALDKKYDTIRFIWTVNLGGIPVRTDATWFCPNKYAVKVTDRDLEDLRYCYDMVCIDIGHSRGVTHCQWAANMPRLRYLVIADTNIKDLTPLAGLEELVFLEVFTSPVRDYTPLLQCPGLEDLNLGYTYGDPAPVMEMTWLKRLWWPGSLRVLTWSVRKDLREKLPDTKMNFVAGSSTGEGWRSGQRYYEMRDILGMEYMTG